MTQAGKRWRRVAFGLFLVAALAACRRPPQGSGVEAAAERKTGPFAELEVQGDFEVTVELGRAQHRVSVTADDNLVGLLRTDSNGRRLHVRFDGDVHPRVRPRLRIEAPDLVLVRCIGTVDLHASQVRNARFQLDLRGTGSAMVTGSTQKLKVFIDGAGTASLEALAIEEALVNVSGNGRADVASPRQLEVELHGNAAVSYSGTPRLESTIRDLGKLTRRP